MKRIIFLPFLLFICSCTKEKVDENHYFISAFNYVSKKGNDKYPMKLRCEFMIHLYHDSVQLYQNSKNEVFWSEKIKINKSKSDLIKSILNEDLSEAQIVEYPVKGIICCGPFVDGPYLFGSICGSKGDLYSPINFRKNETLIYFHKKLKHLKKGKFSSLMYKEVFFQTTWMNLNEYEDIPEAQKQIQFLPPVQE